MKRLILMRHAKSDWSGGALSDFERELNPRGERSAAAMGDWMRAHDLRPDHILCSEATRTQETLARLRLGDDIPVTRTRSLYLASADVMATALKARTEACVMIIAHNPGCAILAEQLANRAPDHPDFDAYPTCATLVLDFDIRSWKDLPQRQGQVIHFVVPRAFTD